MFKKLCQKFVDHSDNVSVALLAGQHTNYGCLKKLERPYSDSWILSRVRFELH